MPCSRHDAASSVSLGSDRRALTNSRPCAVASSARIRPLSLNADVDGANTRPLRSNGSTTDRSSSRTSRGFPAPARSSWTTTALRKVTASERRKNSSSSAAATALLMASTMMFVSRAYLGSSPLLEHVDETAAFPERGYPARQLPAERHQVERPIDRVGFGCRPKRATRLVELSLIDDHVLADPSSAANGPFRFTMKSGRHARSFVCMKSVSHLYGRRKRPAFCPLLCPTSPCVPSLA